MNRSEVLIFSADALAAALIGASVELAGYTPMFAREGEPARDALRRVRPVAVLVDCDHEDACNEHFLGPVMMTGAAVLVFSSARSRSDAAALVARFGVAAFTLPIAVEELGAIVRAAVGPGA